MTMLETILNIREISEYLEKAMEHQPRLYSHSLHTALYAEDIGTEMGLDDQNMYVLLSGAILHDAGKLRVPTRTLERSRTLTSPQWDLMHVHPLLGLIDAPDWLSPDALDIVRHHHEKLDGSGYPDGLKGNAIKPLTRIVTVADIFEAITAKRSYKGRSTKDEALGILRMDVENGKLDADVVGVLIRCIEDGDKRRASFLRCMGELNRECDFSNPPLK